MNEWLTAQKEHTWHSITALAPTRHSTDWGKETRDSGQRTGRGRQQVAKSELEKKKPSETHRLGTASEWPHQGATDSEMSRWLVERSEARTESSHSNLSEGRLSTHFSRAPAILPLPIQTFISLPLSPGSF